jgi:hypothetical protein
VPCSTEPEEAATRLRRLTRRDPINTVALERRIAARVIDARGYPG